MKYIIPVLKALPVNLVTKDTTVTEFVGSNTPEYRQYVAIKTDLAKLSAFRAQAVDLLATDPKSAVAYAAASNFITRDQSRRLFAKVGLWKSRRRNLNTGATTTDALETELETTLAYAAKLRTEIELRQWTGTLQAVIKEANKPGAHPQQVAALRRAF